jgi:hypothetical protein
MQYLTACRGKEAVETAKRLVEALSVEQLQDISRYRLSKDSLDFLMSSKTMVEQ